MAKVRKVMRVTRVKARVIGKPRVLFVVAEGIVSTRGWTQLKLSPHIYIRPPAKGIQGFTFSGKPPSGIVPQVLTKVRAKVKMRAPKWLKAVRVEAAQNSKVARV